MIEKYLGTRESLKAVVLLVDIRHAPTKDDVMMFEWIRSSGLEMVIALTKLDKIKRSQKDKQIKMIRTTLGCGPDVMVIPYSAVTKQGREEILSLMDAYFPES